MTTYEERLEACREEGHQGHLTCSWCGEEAQLYEPNAITGELPLPEGVKLEGDTLEWSTWVDLMGARGEGRSEVTRKLRLSFPDGRSEQLELRLSDYGLTWMHRLGAGESHGSSGGKGSDVGQELARAMRDINDPECSGRSIYAYIMAPSGTVHRYSSHDRVGIGTVLTVRSSCGRMVTGPRLSVHDITADSKACGGCGQAL